MRVLLVRPEDDLKGPWVSRHWDRVVDLAGGAGPYAEAVPQLGATDFARIRNALTFGTGVLIDSYGIDWWDLLSVEFHQWLEKLQVLRHLGGGLDPDDEIFATRSGLELRMLQMILDRDLHFFSHSHQSRNTLRGRITQILKFRPRQVVEILVDKYDSGYRLRRLFSRARPRFAGEVVLAPSSYVNASRGAAAYASAVPEAEFLLVATRASGLLQEHPRNMHNTRLACYASAAVDQDEMVCVLKAWRQLGARLAAHEDWSVLTQFGVLNSVPSLLRNGMRVRDAWLNVFESVNVRAVLCGDEMNPFTRLPLCIAKQRGIAAFAFHHGALDGRYRYRDNSADLMLAKSKMEIDYLVNECGVTEDKIALVPIANRQSQIRRDRRKSVVVFFSEPYEVVGGRCRDVYQQVLPGLSRLARESGRDLVLKLHPQENRRQRESIAAAVIGAGEFRIVDGPLVSDLLDQTHFAVTVSSTAAVDCSQRGIPAFVCSWLDRSHYRYGEQFVKFRAAIPLRSPEQIVEIPGLVVSHEAPKVGKSRDSQVQGSRLRQLLAGGPDKGPAKDKLPEPAWA
jgi:hypothetical protein